MAGPTVPAPVRSTAPKPTPTGSAARTSASYPIAGRAPSWASGVVAADGTAAERKHATALSGARRGPVSVAAVILTPKSWAELKPTAETKAALRGSLKHKVIRAPLLPERRADLTACSKGDYRSHWEGFARALAAAGIDDPTLDLGSGEPKALAEPAAFAGCYRQVAAAVRGVLPRARMQWTVDRGVSATTDPAVLAVTWPGDGVVDIVGIHALDTGDNWGKTVNGIGGLNWWGDFAADRNARIALSGWGPAPGSAVSAENASYVQNMHDWLSRMAARGMLAYDLYSEPSEAAAGTAARVYRALFR